MSFLRTRSFHARQALFALCRADSVRVSYQRSHVRLGHDDSGSSDFRDGGRGLSASDDDDISSAAVKDAASLVLKEKVDIINPHARIDLTSTRLKIKPKDKEKLRWIDSLRVQFSGGRGGHGYPQKGGCGGKGGDCIIVTEEVTPNKSPDLYGLFERNFKDKKQAVKADNGGNASKRKLRGDIGQDRILNVPPGLCLVNDSGAIVRDLNSPGERVTVAAGGEGGGPANGWMGQVGQKLHLRLDLKLIADIGLVGFPNAGKSTLLKAISRARPKVAGYPFTTLRPLLGHIAYHDLRVITMADLPGIIEGAHYNVGMGHRFLKHLERTRLLLFVVDVQGFRLREDCDFRDAFQTIALLNRELELYCPEFVKKPAVCLVNKMDTEGAQEKLRQIELSLNDDYEESLLSLPEEFRPQSRMHFDDVLPMSAKFSQRSVQAVKKRLREWIDAHEEEADVMSVQQLRTELQDQSVPKGPSIV